MSEFEDAKARHQSEMVFPIGPPNDAYAKFFIGRSYLQYVSTSQVVAYNVTFEPGCRNNWHIHHAERAADRSCSALQDEAIIRSGARSRASCIRATL